MSALFDARQRDAQDATQLALASEREVDGDRIDELEKANVALQDEVTNLIAEVERVAKQRAYWIERYLELVEVTATRTDQAAHARS